MSQPCSGTEAAVLCGGDSRRLGFAKEMLRVDGAPLAVQMVRRLEPLFDRVAVVTGRPDYLAPWPEVTVIEDEFPGDGPLAGVHAALKALQADRCLFLPVDMPFVHNDLLDRLCRGAEEGRADVVMGAPGGRWEPMPAVFRRRMAPRLEGLLEDGDGPPVRAALDDADVRRLELQERLARCYRDIDSPEDVERLKEVFEDVEPLPVRWVELDDGRADTVAEERPVTLYGNGLKLATVLCLPRALRQVAAGVAAYLGLIEERSELHRMEVDYRGRRVRMELDATDEDIRRSAQVLVTSTCGATIYGGGRSPHAEGRTEGGFTIAGRRLTDGLRKLRAMAPVFDSTGATHQAACIGAGGSVRYFAEGVGRHSAVDRLVGAAVLDDTPLARTALLSTGRISSEMVVKTARAGMPLAASRSAATSNAVDLAAKHGVTLVGFARGDRMNVYTGGERVKRDE